MPDPGQMLPCADPCHAYLCGRAKKCIHTGDHGESSLVAGISGHRVYGFAGFAAHRDRQKFLFGRWSVTGYRTGWAIRAWQGVFWAFSISEVGCYGAVPMAGQYGMCPQRDQHETFSARAAGTERQRSGFARRNRLH